jgi:hypothetical protein
VRSAGSEARHREGFDVDKCISCQYYDRKHARAAAGGAPQWGQCRRTAPMLNPVNAKSYMIEGVWPTVRDDDWCGEWKILARRVDSRVAEALNSPLMTGPQSLSASAPRVASLTTMTPSNSHGSAGASPMSASPTPAAAPVAAMRISGSD